MKKRYIIGIVILLVVLLWSWLHQGKTLETSLVQVKRGNITQKIIAIGDMTPQHSITIKSPISGTVGAIFHQAGDYVTKGDKLLQVKPAPLPSDYATDKQQLAQANIDKSAKLKTLNSYRFLLKKRAIRADNKDYLQALSDYKQAVTIAELAKQKVQLVEKGQATIAGIVVTNSVRAPISGYILQRDVDVGDPVIGQNSAQQANPLFTIANMKDMMFKGQVSEIDAAKIKPKMAASIQVAAFPKMKITGKISKIALVSISQSEQNNPNMSTAGLNGGSNNDSPFNVGFQIEIDHLHLPKPLLLRDGYSATASIIIKTANNALLIPERVVHFDNDDTFVYLQRAGKPHKQNVKLGISDGINVQVLNGLKLDDKIYPQAPGVE